MRVAALIPAYQAAARLGEVLLRLEALAEPPAVLVVDDGSRDATAEVAVPTVYGGERSQIHTLRDVPRIVGTLVRLTWEGAAPPRAMRAARIHLAGGTR